MDTSNCQVVISMDYPINHVNLNTTNINYFTSRTDLGVAQFIIYPATVHDLHLPGRTDTSLIRVIQLALPGGSRVTCMVF